MARTAGAKLGLGLGLLLLLGLRDGPRAARGDDHTLCYNFTVIPKPGPGQPWCEVQGTITGNKFLDYHCGSEKVTPVGPLGMEVNGTDTWRSQSEALRDLVEELRKKLLDIKPQISTTSDPLLLQGRMMCSCKANGCTSKARNFDVCILEDGNCTVVETLDNDRDLMESLRKTSDGDCRSWLETFLMHWGKMLETTASTTTAPASAQSRATAIMPITWIPLVTLTCSILLGILGQVLYSNRLMLPPGSS